MVARFGKSLGEALNPCGRREPEGVQALVVITRDEKSGPGVRHPMDELQIHRVQILKLVDNYVPDNGVIYKIKIKSGTASNGGLDGRRT